jgi:predicted TIM-barrel fold metal-dependent hydrolase
MNQGESVQTRSVTDAFATHEWASVTDLAPYLSAGWRELILRPDDPAGPSAAVSNWRYRSPLDTKADDAYPAEGPAGSDPAMLVEQLLRPGDIDRAVLGYDDGLLATAHANHYLARLMARAANEWTVDRWLSADERLHALILVATALPEHAAAEIRRAGRHPRMVGVSLGANGLARPFGHPVYHPIYEAAVELDLPVVIQVGSDAATDLLTKPVAGGLPATHAEYSALGFQAPATHVASMIGQGVFDLFPTLRVLLVAGGLTWIPAYLWRFDYWHHMNGRETPWLSQLPSEYFLEHVGVTTYDAERAATPEQLAQALGAMPGIERSLVYASGYPSALSARPAQVAQRLPEAWHDALFAGNAERVFRWPGSPRTVARREPISPMALAEPALAVSSPEGR